MIVYYIFTVLILLIQAVVMLEAYRHVVYTKRKYRPKPSRYQPRVGLISPCKGSDTAFERNINSFFDLDYPDYEIFFVVESDTDPAHSRLSQIIKKRRRDGCSIKAHLLIAGLAKTSSQKVHNQITACDALPDDIKVLAFVDSDACLKPHFLSSLIHPLRRKGVGASTGYRWFVPTDSALSSKFLSAINAFVASSLGPHSWNCAWGGAMAIRRDVFDAIELRSAWQNACSDDYVLTRRVKQADLEIIFVPACFVASYEQMSWSEMFSFARRQFILTRICFGRLWYLAIGSLGHFVLAFYFGLFLTLYLVAQGSSQAIYAGILPVGLLVSAMTRATVRQVLIRKILPEDRARLRGPALIDIFAQPIVAIIALFYVLSAAGARTITWRGIRYYLHDIYHTEVSCR